MKCWHRHQWTPTAVDRRRDVTFGKPGHGFTYVLAVCACGRRKVTRLDGHWMLDEIRTSTGGP